MSPISSSAESNSSVKQDLSYETYLELIDLKILDESFSYEKWIEINSEERSNPLNSNVKNNSTSSTSSTFSTSSLVKGDILITNGTSSFGLTGHAGIVVGRNQILHISGYGAEPKIISYATWNKNYSKEAGGMINTEVYRISNTTQSNAAANWAIETYMDSGAGYSLMSSLDSFAYTYCSKIVWQAYYYGPSTPLVNEPTMGIATPYGLPTYFKSSAGLSYKFNF